MSSFIGEFGICHCGPVVIIIKSLESQGKSNCCQNSVCFLSFFCALEKNRPKFEKKKKSFVTKSIF